MSTNIKEIKKYAKENKVPIMEDASLAYMKTFIEKNNIKDILEIGTAIGYSAINMASISNDIKITSIERDEKRYLDAVQNVKDMNLEDRITLIFNDALDVILDQEFDLIFIDAAKSQNIKFFNHFEKYLKEKGYIITDNIYFHGMVEGNDEDIKSKDLLALVHKVRDYIEFLKTNTKYHTDFIRVGDGISVSEKL